MAIATLIAAGRLDDRLIDRALGSLREIDPNAAFAGWIDEGDAVTALEPKVLDSVKTVIDTSLSSGQACTYTLAFHVVAGLIAAWIGTRRHQWD